MAQHDLTDLVARIQAAGGSMDDLLTVNDVAEYAGQVFAWNRRAEAAAHTFVSEFEARARRATTVTTTSSAPLATDGQIDYALDLIAARIRSGEGGGHLAFSGGYPDRDALARMTRRQISSLIDQMRDAW